MLIDYDYETKKVVVRYNPRRLVHWSEELIIAGIFHEIGHITQGNLPYETDKQIIYAEWDAECYALKMMKKHYPKKDVDHVINYYKKKLNGSRFKREQPLHYEAFKDVPEYQ